ncbi:tRNA pseudouridine(55) synthase TruB [Vitreoscilla stercoraria]|uniref:tRNA pseudouridine synthase B n=1 Tax=Vitreoscilla stercoraria TaxID=61 RepID=A0ABY4ECI1_VITST|nr:tRNA pseudouridine(55) synthase TruB [Vitreoscilla stercoraria]UOO93457.1 tRNA pseudouridine(55) synthase TruB [Vitreoscilla stercoraria]
MTTSTKPPKRRINGVLLLDKPKGKSSNTALQITKRLFQAEKAGHTGVLDPLATGLLPVCFGEATKYAQYLLDSDKAYIADLKFGIETTTGDVEGEASSTTDVRINAQQFQDACVAFTRSYEQMPPMFSALKHNGKALYEYARQGINIERKRRTITIYQIDVLAFDEAAQTAQIAVRCSKGTYIRTLAEDIARHAGSLAHLTDLRRTATAGFGIEHAYSIETLESLNLEQKDGLLLPCEALVAHLPAITLQNAEIERLQYGQQVQSDAICEIISPLRVYDDAQQFMGLIEASAEGVLKALRLMSTQNNL